MVWNLATESSVDAITVHRRYGCSSPSQLQLDFLDEEKGTAWLSRRRELHAFGHAYSPWSDMAGSFRGELIKRGF